MSIIKIGVFLFLILFLGLLTCDASNPILLQPSRHDNQVCELCDKYLTLAIDYLRNDDNQNALVEALHTTCSQIPPPQKQCLSMVDHYTQLLFTKVSLLNPHHLCKTINLCQPPLASQGNCEACRDTVSQLVTKLKDPQTKLKIIRLLLKECKSLNTYQDKCKKMVFEYGPLMLADLENFLEKKDLCSILGVCPPPPSHSFYLLPSMLADS